MQEASLITSTKATKQQLRAITTKSRRCLCLAGAGSGKTFTLIERINYLVNDLKVDPEKIAVFTFTTSAALELETRYTSQIGCDNVPYFGTFHSFCYSVIHNVEALHALGYSSIPTILDDAEQIVYQTRAKDLTSVKLPMAAFKLNYKVNPKHRWEYTTLIKAYTSMLRKDRVITFDVLNTAVAELFVKNHPSIKSYLSKFLYIFVDEFQDTDAAQWNMLKAFDKYSTLWLCGDIRQNIYSFRGTSNIFIKQLSTNPNWEVIKLEENFRSTQPICCYANNIPYNCEPSSPKLSLWSSRKGQDPEHIDETEFWAEVPNFNKNSAILCKTNAEVLRVCTEFKYRGIPFDAKPVSNNNSIYHAALDNNYQITYFLSLLPESSRINLLRRSNKDSEFNLLLFLQNRFIFEYKQIAEIQNSDNFGEIQMLYHSGELNFSEFEKSGKHNIYVGTIHSVKGLEFDTVCIYGEANQILRKPYIENDYNLYYVACTRAKDRLILVDQS